MLAILRLLAVFIANLFKSRRRLEAEILFLRHQLSIALRQRPARLPLRGSDRVLLVWMTRLWPSLLGMVQVVEPATILRWHRAGFRSYWRWKSRKRAGRPRIDRDLRDLIRRMSRENPLWGAPRIHGELLKLGFELAESTAMGLPIAKAVILRPGLAWCRSKCRRGIAPSLAASPSVETAIYARSSSKGLGPSCYDRQVGQNIALDRGSPPQHGDCIAIF